MLWLFKVIFNPRKKISMLEYSKVIHKRKNFLPYTLKMISNLNNGASEAYWSKHKEENRFLQNPGQY